MWQRLRPDMHMTLAGLMLLLPPLLQRGTAEASCASDRGETLPCCGQQARDPGCPASCTVDVQHRCGALLPVCRGYVFGTRFGTCEMCPSCNSPEAATPEMLKMIEAGFCPGCDSSWGWVLLITLGVCGALYFGGGVGYAVKMQGAALGIAAHPHFERMQQGKYSLSPPAACRF